MNNETQRPLNILVAGTGTAAARPELLQLTALGHRLDEARGVDEAVVALDRQAYDIVLMDAEHSDAAAFCRLREHARSLPDAPSIVPVGEAGPGLDHGGPGLRWGSLITELPALAFKSTSGPACAWRHVDAGKALEAADGDQDLLGSLVNLFFEQLPTLTSALRAGIDQRDARAVERHAHSLKGAIGVFGARAAWLAACDMEYLGRQSRWEEAEEKWAALQDRLADVEPELRELGTRAAAGQIAT